MFYNSALAQCVLSLAYKSLSQCTVTHLTTPHFELTVFPVIVLLSILVYHGGKTIL